MISSEQKLRHSLPAVGPVFPLPFACQLPAPPMPHREWESSTPPLSHQENDAPLISTPGNETSSFRYSMEFPPEPRTDFQCSAACGRVDMVPSYCTKSFQLYKKNASNGQARSDQPQYLNNNLASPTDIHGGNVNSADKKHVLGFGAVHQL